MSATSSAVIAVPTGSYSVDPVHSRVGFSVRHLGINMVKGRFERFEATFTVAEDGTTIDVSGAIEAASINTGFAQRDEHLRSPDFFDVERHPQISFTATGTKPRDDADFELIGKITIRGVSRSITLKVAVGGTAPDQYGNQRVGLTAAGKLRRSDFHMPYDETVQGIPLVGDLITLELDIEAIRQP